MDDTMFSWSYANFLLAPSPGFEWCRKCQFPQGGLKCLVPMYQLFLLSPFLNGTLYTVATKQSQLNMETVI